MLKLKKPHQYLLLSAVVILLAAGALLVIRATQNGPSENSGSLPQSGTYTITDVNSMVCTLKLPPDCSGSVVLRSDSNEVDALVDRETKVRYQNKEVQVYPDALAKDMTVQVVFRPGSKVIDTAVIAE